MEKVCLYCGKKFETKTKNFCCCNEHTIIFRNHRKFPEGSDYVECKVCGYRARELNKHITNFHSMSVEEYCCKFNVDQKTLITDQRRKENSETQKKAYREGRNKGWENGGINPAKSEESKSGKRSPFSMNFSGYDGLSDSEKIKRIAEMKCKCVNIKKKNHSNPLTLDYYTSKGYTEEQASKLLKERQTTFSLEKCIEKYGKEKGYTVWKKRQETWQNTLNNLPEEEKKRINKLKANSSINICSYSKISQKLFNDIYNIIKYDYRDIYYATCNKEKYNSNKNHEYEVLLEDGIHRFFLDFYIKDINKAIEFDGDYWHGEKRGNQERDRIREENLNRLGYTKIYRVKERDYLKNPEQTIDECIKFIKGNDYEAVRSN